MSGYGSTNQNLPGHVSQPQNMAQSMDGDPMALLDDFSQQTMAGGQSLDDLMTMTTAAMDPQSLAAGFPQGSTAMDPSMNMTSDLDNMVAFSGLTNDSALQSFQFDPNAAMAPQAGLDALTVQLQQQQQRHLQQQRMQQRIQLMQRQQLQRQQQRQLQQHLQQQQQQQQQQQRQLQRQNAYPSDMNAVNSPFSDSVSPSVYNNASGHTSSYQTPLHPSSGLANQVSMSGMDFSDASSQMVFDNNQAGFGTPNVVPSNASATLSQPQPSEHTKMQSPYRNDSMPASLTRDSSSARSQSRTDSKTSAPPPESKQASISNQHAGFAAQPQNPEPGSRDDKGVASGPHPYPNGFQPKSSSLNGPSNEPLPWPTPSGGWPSSMVGRPHTQTQYKNAYSSSGFDMLGVLMRVATRPNPDINLGSVDMSCAFVVCDVNQQDFPIVYCSDNFERLTGYDKSQVLGRNCRFLQSPTGQVAPGVKRQYVDDDSVLYLKNMINARREAQISLINYRRGGQPFMNLLTMIPITWDSDQVRFFVGFQVDLVEQPNAVTNKNADGSYSVNYQRGSMPRYIMNAPENSAKVDVGQTISHTDVTSILTSIGTGDSEYAKRMWDRVLLENTDDVIHVLSLKGLFQWISPSSKKLLEYEPGELIGTALSSVCHPSDIVPVTRELKDTSSGSPVNVVFRIRRKNSGYMWFEGHGSLHTEQGKGRKSIIMVGRERPVYTLSKDAIVSDGGITESELWTKMSTSGMFLFVSSNVRHLLDRQPEDLVGVSVQTLMRAESKKEFGNALDLARTGRKASVKHEVINRRGQVLQALTTLYPGDATEGLKPTFIVAQTRLIKYSRNSSLSRPSIFGKTQRSQSDGMVASAMSTADGTKSPQQQLLAVQSADLSARPERGLPLGHQDSILAADDNLFEELKTTKSSSWQYEIRQLEKRNRLLAEGVQSLLAAKKKRKRRNGAGQMQRDCANCHTRNTPEWRRGPSGQRDLCNSCGLRWAKINGRVSPRTSSQQSVQSDKASRASISPRTSIVKIENGQAGQGDATTNDANPHLINGHSSDMQGAAGVPESIEEGVEPE